MLISEASQLTFRVLGKLKNVVLGTAMNHHDSVFSLVLHQSR